MKVSNRVVVLLTHCAAAMRDGEATGVPEVESASRYSPSTPKIRQANLKPFCSLSMVAVTASMMP